MIRKESLGKRIGNAIAMKTERVLVSAASKLFTDIESKTPGAIAGTILKKMNVAPAYLRKQTDSPEEFATLRKKLEREPGILISNHPGGVDALALLSMLHRKDILILVGGRRLKKYEVAPAIRDHLIQRTQDPKELRLQLERIREHIAKGGLFIMFPTGGDKHSQRFTFKDGFRVIVQKVLRPTDMVYVCNVNAEDAEKIRTEQGRHYAGLFSDGIFGGMININKLTERKKIRIDERYTTAREWQKIIAADNSKAETNRTLTEHYRGLWKKDALQSSL